MEIPKKITPCPIIDTIIEIRYESRIPSDAIFGILFKAFENVFPKLVKLPILQVPEMIRSKDPNFKFRPHYQMKNDKYVFQIGPSAISVNNVGEYVGWEVFRVKILEAFKKVSELDFIENVFRLGIRYINFFDFNIFEKINLELTIGEELLKKETLSLRSELKSDGFLNILQVTNHASRIIEGNEIFGSIIDIDTLYETREDFFKEMETILERGHLTEKQLFFKLLKTDFLETLNPEY